MTESESNALHDSAALRSLVSRGVSIPGPDKIAIGREVPLEAIASGARINPFSSIYGSDTKIGAGAIVGASGAATIENSWVAENAIVGNLGPVTLKRTVAGPGTVLGCGVAEDAVFLGKEVDDPAFTTGYGFRVRKGSLYEEDANSAQHTDTKMTILQPWVTLGSNINWCDVLVGGGSGPGLGEFSEVGSGAVHFNFTPRGDKATASLLGDVVNGVFLHQPRLFLGGNSSLIGPAAAQFGAITGAGGRYGKSLLAGLNETLAEGTGRLAEPFDLDVYGAIKRVFDSQVRIIGQLSALDAWYAGVRNLIAGSDSARAELYKRGRGIVGMNIEERISQLAGLAARMENSVRKLSAHNPHDARLVQQRALFDHWEQIEARLLDHSTHHDAPPRVLLEGLNASMTQFGDRYTAAIRNLDDNARNAGSQWLQGIAARVADETLLALVPEISR